MSNGLKKAGGVKFLCYAFYFSMFIFSFSLASAQDTSKPVIMSQAAYDSTLRALKKAAEVIKKDTVKAVAAPVVHDTVKAVVVDTTDKKKQTKHITEKMLGVYSDTVPKPKAIAKPKPDLTGYLALSAGEAYPQGAFKRYGYPSKGGVVSFSAMFPGIVSHFGVAFKFDYGFDGLDKLRYADSLKSSVSNSNLSYKVADGSYKYTYFNAMMGLCYTYPFNNRFSVDARILFGAMMASLPAFDVKVFDNVNYIAVTQHNYQASGRSLAWDEGISVRYLVLPQLAVMLALDNYSANPKFALTNNSIETNQFGAASETTTKVTNITQAFHLLSVSVGAGYTITAKKAKAVSE